MIANARIFGNTPVPFTVAWTGEATFFVARCDFTGRPAICQAVAPGEGTPTFGKPHSQRQRQAISQDLCDLCGRSFRLKTKVSLSHARVRANGADGPCIMQVEPLLHRNCAAECIRWCRSLKRDLRDGTLMIRQVGRHRAQYAVMDPVYIRHYVPGYVAQAEDRIIGHAKVELFKWVDRDEEWLTGPRVAA